MPYTLKEKKLHRNLVKEYGKKKGDEVYHKMARQAHGKYRNLFGSITKRKNPKK
jgi:hypothetical protein